MRAFDIAVQAHLLIGGLAMVFVGWRARWPVASCVLAATLFMLGGPASGRLQHTGIILSYSAFPLALLFLQLGLERRSYILALGFSVVAASMALGRNQVALLLCALLTAAAVVEILGAQKSTRYLRERGGVVAFMIVVGGALLFVPLLLTAQFAILSNRPSEGLAEALRGSLHPANFATVAIPNIFGTHSVYWGPGAATSAEVDLTDDSENYLFLGAVPILILLWFGVAGRSAWRPGRRLMACALVISCIFMLGRYTPLYGFGFRFVSGIDLFRRPTDASFVFVIAAAFLSGDCLTDYVRNGMPQFRIVNTLPPLFATFAVAFSAVEFSARTGHAADAMHEVLISLALMLAAGLFLFFARSAPARAMAAMVVTVAAVTELTWWNAASRLNAEPWNFYAVLEAPSGANAAAIALLEQSIEADHRRGNYPRVEVLGLGGPWQNLAMVRGSEATNGYNPLRIGSYDRLVSPGEQNWDVSQRQFPRSFDNYSCSLAKALGLTYLVLGSPLQDLPGLSILPSSDLLLSGPPVWLYKLQGASPRVSMVSQVDSAAVDFAPFSRPEYDSPSGIGVPPDDGGTAGPPHAGAPGLAKIEFSALSRLDVVTASTTVGFLLVHDLFYPGWIAEIDGRRMPVVRADGLFRAVEVPAGVHHVTFSFAPFSSENLKGALVHALGLWTAPR